MPLKSTIPGLLQPCSGCGNEHNFQETALGLQAYRQQLMTSKIANAGTLSCKVVTIDFQEVLQILQSGLNPGYKFFRPHRRPVAKHFATLGLKCNTPSQAYINGHTVVMDTERAKLAENEVIYEFALDRVSGHHKVMAELFQNIK